MNNMLRLLLSMMILLISMPLYSQKKKHKWSDPCTCAGVYLLDSSKLTDTSILPNTNKYSRVKTGYYGLDTNTINRVTKVKSLKDSVERQVVENPLKALESCIDCGMNFKVKKIYSVNSLVFDSKEPLWIVNGCIIEGPWENAIKGHEGDFKVRSVDFIRDSIATSIYGARGANGVYLITIDRISKNSKVNYKFISGCKLFRSNRKYIRRTRAGYFIRFRFRKAFEKR